MDIREHPSREIQYRNAKTGNFLQILCDDNTGRAYILPFLCKWQSGNWFAKKRTRPISATVVRWRLPTGNWARSNGQT